MDLRGSLSRKKAAAKKYSNIREDKQFIKQKSRSLKNGIKLRRKKPRGIIIHGQR